MTLKMISPEPQLEIVKKLTFISNETIKPEPQFSNFSKYLANHFHSRCNEKKALVHLTNSHGVQLRSDINYWTDTREDFSTEDVKKEGPVLECSHLNLFANFDEILDKIRELPEEWTVIQITREFTPQDVLKGINENWDSGIYITRFVCGKLAERLHPYYIHVKSGNHTEENLMLLLKDLIKIRRNYFTSGGTSRKAKEEYSTTDPGLMKLVFEVESHWLKQWRCLLGGRLEDRNMEEETIILIKNALDNFQKKTKKKIRLNEKTLDIIYQVTLSAHCMKNNEILKALSYALFNCELEKDSTLTLLMEDLKTINLKNSCAVKRAEKNPVILIVDNAFELIPWEMLNILTNQPVCRILSLHLLYGLFKYHQPNIVDGYRRIKIDSGFCLVNPGKDLNECEKEMTLFLKKQMPWIETEIGKIPDPKELVSKFQDYNIYFYCGHGSGMQYLKPSDLKKAIVKGLVLLFGCSSNLPKNAGGRTPYHNDTYTYITNGCPCLIGCIYDITSSDADRACKEMLLSFLPTLTKEGSKFSVRMPEQTDVLKGVIGGKISCTKYWSQCSLVARGIPCKTEKGDLIVSRF